MEEDQVSVTIDNHEFSNAGSDCDESSPAIPPDPFKEFTRDGTMTRVEVTSFPYVLCSGFFLAYLEAHAVQVRVEAVHKILYPGFLAKARREAFRIFMKAVSEKCGGDSRSTYAWYGGSREDISQIVSHGFNRCGSGSASGVSHGVGIYLTPYRRLPHCVGSSVPDNYGLRHMLLCWVIMGKPEVIPAGSKQCQPSSLEFDTGVDNLVSPRSLIVWGAFMNSHILPVLMISFTVPPSFNSLRIDQQVADQLRHG